MSKVTMIVGHPNLNGGSLANKIIVDRVQELADVEVCDLTALYPDFHFDVEREQVKLLESDVIILQFPFFWYSIPGILKHWLDEILTYGFAYGSTGDKLKGKKLIVSSTIGGPEESYNGEDGYNSFTIEDFMKPLVQTARLTQMVYKDPVITHSMTYIPNVYNVKEEVEARAVDHADRLIERIKSAL